MSLRGLRAKTAVLRVFCALLALCFAPCAPAFAEPLLSLSWRSPDECPNERWASQQISQQLGRDLATESSAPFRAEVQIARVADLYRLTLRTSRGDSHGERTLEDAQCQPLSEAAALMIALAIDADVGQAPVTPAPEVGVLPAKDGETPPGLKPEQNAPTKAEEPLGARVRVSALGELGFLPEPSLGPELAVGVHRGPWGLELSGFWLPERKSQGNERVAVSLWAASVRGCLEHATYRFRLAGCLGGELGRVSADGQGLSENLRKRALFVAANAPLRARVRMVGPVWLALDVGLAVPILRQRFVTRDTAGDNQRVLHTPRLLTARASLGAELSF